MSDTGFGWIFSPDTAKKIVVPSQTDFFNSSSFFHTLLEFIQDGVSVLDKDLNVLYVNTTISNLYLQDNSVDALNQKCYSIYHQRKTPCENCPTLQTLKTKTPHMDVVSYNRKDKKTGWHELFSIPVFNEQDEIVLIIEYIRDITFQKFIRSNLAEIEQRFKALENQNEMLIQILNQREKS
ncbi:MAG: PAS domain-containing protein [Eubacteriales bacterium]